MGLTFGMPHGIGDDLESALAAIQTWAGKQEGNGKWIDAVKDGAGLAGYLRVDGLGNSWTAGGSGQSLSIAYTLIGSTMTLSFFLSNTTLTIASGTTQILILIPDGYQAVGRYVASAGYMINNSVAQGARIYTLLTQRTYIGIDQMDAGVYVTDPNFTVEGQIQFEASRS